MIKNTFFYILALSLPILTVIPSRLAFAVVILILVNILLYAGTLIQAVGDMYISKGMKQFFVFIALTGITVLFKQLLFLFSPVIALQLSFSLYITCFCSLLAGIIFTNTEPSLSIQLKENGKQITSFSGFVLAFFLIRDILGFGTITFPIPSGILEIQPLKIFSGFSFFGTIIGAYFLLAVFLLLYRVILAEKEV